MCGRKMIDSCLPVIRINTNVCIQVYNISTLDVVLKLRNINARISLPLIRIEIIPFALVCVLIFMATLFPSSLESATT